MTMKHRYQVLMRRGRSCPQSRSLAASNIPKITPAALLLFVLLFYNCVCDANILKIKRKKVYNPFVDGEAEESEGGKLMLSH